LGEVKLIAGGGDITYEENGTTKIEPLAKTTLLSGNTATLNIGKDNNLQYIYLGRKVEKLKNNETNTTTTVGTSISIGGNTAFSDCVRIGYDSPTSDENIFKVLGDSEFSGNIEIATYTPTGGTSTGGSLNAAAFLSAGQGLIIGSVDSPLVKMEVVSSGTKSIKFDSTATQIGIRA
jgi:hypothetical protein